MSLLTPADLGGWRLPNRVVLAPTTRAHVPGGVPGEPQAAYYAERAGAGLIVTEGTWVSERAVGFLDVPGLYTEDQVAGWRQVTDVVHALGGRIVVQLWHTGAVSHPDFLGARPAGPSAVNPEESVHTASGPRPTAQQQRTHNRPATTASRWRPTACTCSRSSCTRGRTAAPTRTGVAAPSCCWRSSMPCVPPESLSGYGFRRGGRADCSLWTNPCAPNTTSWSPGSTSRTCTSADPTPGRTSPASRGIGVCSMARSS